MLRQFMDRCSLHPPPQVPARKPQSSSRMFQRPKTHRIQGTCGYGFVQVYTMSGGTIQVGVHRVNGENNCG